MAHYANQFTIQNQKAYPYLDANDTLLACHELNGVALKLYIYLCSQKNYEPYYFYPSVVCEICNISMTAEKTAFKELISHGFLKKQAQNFYIFSPSKNDIT